MMPDLERELLTQQSNANMLRFFREEIKNNSLKQIPYNVRSNLKAAGLIRQTRSNYDTELELTEQGKKLLNDHAERVLRVEEIE